MFVTPHINVLELKHTIFESADVKYLRFMFSGKQLDDNNTLASYNIRHGDTIEVLLRLLGGGFNFYVIKEDF
ncbi:hypothetical protein C1645_782170 [Glomus cerebriforme]|uniref:Ubiquitin-like domain-containing protein n=1 Tax=Glomus cerebriforme TaxID=658196 RepID=A0A397SGE3_9GLOM|nr:hypothetical protein C1645_782170 [Glomus cerebriforme]